MMGRKDDRQGHFFYHFKLDERIPQDHLLRGIDQFLDLSQLNAPTRGTKTGTTPSSMRLISSQLSLRLYVRKH